MKRRNKSNSLSTQMKRRVAEKPKEEKENEGNFDTVISTGSTLLDLAISGGRIHGGGIPGGILVEVFGPSSSGKTVLLSEIAGNVQRQGGQIIFHDPEARLNTQFAKLFGLELEEKDHTRPNTVTEVFEAVRNWEPDNPKAVNGIFADSLTALSTKMEMEEKDGDPYGTRRAKEFSEQLRLTCRTLADKNYLMVCSNQIRQNINAKMYEQKWVVPGGEAMTFYPSLRLRFMKPERKTREITFKGEKIKKVIGVETTIEVYKSTVWKPFETASVTILFDYGIDDIRDSLQFVKSNTNASTYILEGNSIGKSMDDAISYIESNKLESVLKEEVIGLWEEIQTKFASNRKPKH